MLFRLCHVCRVTLEVCWPADVCWCCSGIVRFAGSRLSCVGRQMCVDVVQALSGLLDHAWAVLAGRCVLLLFWHCQVCWVTLELCWPADVCWCCSGIVRFAGSRLRCVGRQMCDDAVQALSCLLGHAWGVLAGRCVLMLFRHCQVCWVTLELYWPADVCWCCSGFVMFAGSRLRCVGGRCVLMLFRHCQVCWVTLELYWPADVCWCCLGFFRFAGSRLRCVGRQMCVDVVQALSGLLGHAWAVLTGRCVLMLFWQCQVCWVTLELYWPADVCWCCSGFVRFAWSCLSCIGRQMCVDVVQALSGLLVHAWGVSAGRCVLMLFRLCQVCWFMLEVFRPADVCWCCSGNVRFAGSRLSCIGRQMCVDVVQALSGLLGHAWGVSAGRCVLMLFWQCQVCWVSLELCWPADVCWCCSGIVRFAGSRLSCIGRQMCVDVVQALSGLLGHASAVLAGRCVLMLFRLCQVCWVMLELCWPADVCWCCSGIVWFAVSCLAALSSISCPTWTTWGWRSTAPRCTTSTITSTATCTWPTCLPATEQTV